MRQFAEIAGGLFLSDSRYIELFRSRQQRASLSPRARRSYLWERMEIRCKPQNWHGVVPVRYDGHPVSPIGTRVHCIFIRAHAHARVHLSLVLPRYVARRLYTALSRSLKFHSCKKDIRNFRNKLAT